MPLRRLAAIVVAVVAFLAISAVLARWLSVENTERALVVRALEAQARGDARALVRAQSGCAASRACAAWSRTDAARLRRRGPVLVVSYESATAHALTGAEGETRVVWKTPSTLTVVQCARVRRKGNAVTGVSVTLLRLTPPIRRTADC